MVYLGLTRLTAGAPRHWLNRNAPYNVQPDFGLFFIDHNGYKMPKAPLVPLIAAVTKRVETNPEVAFDWSSVDFVADRNFLRKLLRWVRNEDPAKDFRFDLELAGEKTVLVNRYEARHREQYNGRTYGYNFEKSSTEAAPGCQKATGHHRIAKYVSFLLYSLEMELSCLPFIPGYESELISPGSQWLEDGRQVRSGRLSPTHTVPEEH